MPGPSVFALEAVECGETPVALQSVYNVGPVKTLLAGIWHPSMPYGSITHHLVKLTPIYSCCCYSLVVKSPHED